MKHNSQIEEILEEDFFFRDYEIKCHTEFRRFNAVGVHRLIDLGDKDLDLWSDISDAIETFSKDGYPMIYFYIKPEEYLKLVD
jgi:hypothetical protein